jgi:hypothetical protein
MNPSVPATKSSQAPCQGYLDPWKVGIESVLRYISFCEPRINECDNLPIGVVSKNEVGDRRTPASAALKRFKLAMRLARLWNHGLRHAEA